MSHKGNLKVKGLELFKKICATNIQVTMIRMDNTGENKLRQNTLEKEEFDIDSQYTAAGTPQQNDYVEQKIATLYGKVRSTLNLARITQGLRCKLWAERATHIMDIKSVIMNKSNEMISFEKIYGKAPRFTSNIRVFGKMGLVCIFGKKIKDKFDNQGIPCMFVGYSKEHKDGVYQMLNISTLKIKKSQCNLVKQELWRMEGHQGTFVKQFQASSGIKI